MFFQSEQYFSLTTSQREQCFGLFFQRSEWGKSIICKNLRQTNKNTGVGRGGGEDCGSTYFGVSNVYLISKPANKSKSIMEITNIRGRGIAHCSECHFSMDRGLLLTGNRCPNRRRLKAGTSVCVYIRERETHTREGGRCTARGSWAESHGVFGFYRKILVPVPSDVWIHAWSIKYRQKK